MSIVGGYSNEVAAGSRLNRWICLLSDWAWAMMDAQKVDLPEPAGPAGGEEVEEWWGQLETNRLVRKVGSAAP